ncbi:MULTISPECIES: DivIVA domain-containing protein [unclassified Kribbella]|uniref:DivIVA domain-containing protein n=1 Tax=unclassified Kribbella TaxID=2644121 RepID=UPI0030177DCD
MLGLDTAKVYGFLDLLADQVHVAERERNAGRAEIERLQMELQRTRAELQRVQAELDEYEQVGERVNEQVVQLFSQAQLVAEEMVQDVSRDARERIGQARAHERQIVAEAMDTAGQQVRSYAQSAQVRMQSIMESFATEVDRLGSTSLSGEPGSHHNDPLFDDLSDRQIRFRNGSGPESPGSD